MSAAAHGLEKADGGKPVGRIGKIFRMSSSSIHFASRRIFFLLLLFKIMSRPQSSSSFFVMDRMCLLGNRLLAEEHSGNCTKEEGSPLWNMYCKYVDVLVDSHGGRNRTVKTPQCDPYFETHDVTRRRGIHGLSSGIFLGTRLLAPFYRSSPDGSRLIPSRPLQRIWAPGI